MLTSNYLRLAVTSLFRWWVTAFFTSSSESNLFATQMRLHTSEQIVVRWGEIRAIKGDGKLRADRTNPNPLRWRDQRVAGRHRKWDRFPSSAVLVFNFEWPLKVSQFKAALIKVAVRINSTRKTPFGSETQWSWLCSMTKSLWTSFFGERQCLHSSDCCLDSEVKW